MHSGLNIELGRTSSGPDNYAAHAKVPRRDVIEPAVATVKAACLFYTGAPSSTPHTMASVQPKAANSAARRGASPMEKNSSSCGGFMLVPDSIAWA